MKKYIARNRKTDDMVFCKYEICKTGVLRVEYYLPKFNYSVIWDKHHPYTRIAGNRYSADGRKSIVTYFIHPAYYAGESFSSDMYDNVFDAMDRCLTANIKLL